MTIEAGKNGERIRQSNRVIRKKKCRATNKVPRRVTPKVSTPLQQLYSACKDVFKGPGTVPPPQDVQKLKHILDNMKPEDIGLSSDLVFYNPKRVGKGTPSVTYSTIYNCKNFSLCLFFLPPTAVIPLHNHPEMTVFSKLLLGSMHIKSYDLVDPDMPDDPKFSPKLRLAKMKANNLFTAPCNTSVLYPTSGGNIHAFSAVTTCAVLDVLGPPYSRNDGRDCTYYKDFSYSSFPNGTMAKAEESGSDAGDDADAVYGYGWLQEIPVPKEYKMDRIEYLGPQVVETSS